MTDAPYTKRELDDHFKQMNERFDRQDTRLISIENTGVATDKKVAIQNGRVSKLETKWYGLVIGGTVCLGLIGTIIGLTIYSFKLSQDNLRQQILLELKK